MLNLTKTFAAVTLLCLSASAVAADDAATALDAAIAGNHRIEAHRMRDAYRHPKETLLFFGLDPRMTVLEMLPGGEGWYTEILAPVLRDNGKLITVTPPLDSNSEYLRKSTQTFNSKLDALPAVYARVERRTMGGKALELGPPNSADMVVTFRSTHNWIRGGQFDAVYRAIHAVLKPGGILGIEQHRGNPGDDAMAKAGSGYVPEDYVIRELEGLGFRFEGKSEINANPKDTKDYADGVWTLPPVLRLGERDRARYVAIGESDRMTLKFSKLQP
jgi:predicted methyltransferase